MSDAQYDRSLYCDNCGLTEEECRTHVCSKRAFKAGGDAREKEVITEIVAWLRTQAKTKSKQSDEAMAGAGGITVSMAYCAEMVALNVAATAFESGEWRKGNEEA